MRKFIIALFLCFATMFPNIFFGQTVDSSKESKLDHIIDQDHLIGEPLLDDVLLGMNDSDKGFIMGMLHAFNITNPASKMAYFGYQDYLLKRKYKERPFRYVELGMIPLGIKEVKYQTVNEYGELLGTNEKMAELFREHDPVNVIRGLNFEGLQTLDHFETFLIVEEKFQSRVFEFTAEGMQVVLVLTHTAGDDFIQWYMYSEIVFGASKTDLSKKDWSLVVRNELALLFLKRIGKYPNETIKLVDRVGPLKP